ncbi:MAG: hypothetical protein H6740_29590 [Alphaproteobacteria bacterium]|nr:hypothetical protein [Alphaproteobacteria bacterium]
MGPTLMDAIETGITAAMLLVREACGFRDTRRRAAVDADWASTHPISEPKERANPTERLGAKGGCACKKKAEVPATVGPPEEPVVSDDPLIGKRYDRMPRERGESVYTYARRLVTEASARAGEGHHRVARELLDEAGRVAAGLSGSKAARVHEHVDHVRGKLEGARRPVADVKKDEALIGAFRDALRQAVGG